MYFIFLETRIVGLHFFADSMSLSRSNSSGGLRNYYFYFCKSDVLAVQSHPRSFGADRKRVCDFLLLRHSNLGPILHRFGDIACFYAFDHTPIPPYFGGSRCTSSPTLGSVLAGTLSFLVVKLFSKYFNLCDHGD